ncbi:hypothetical protein RUM44_003379 [Polyplax serrata]|uniref:TATA box-binding protein-like 1 n=1 Tax=Polyplax serrata TaxID=468196 RepID=A0ABR1AGU3_POLSC
MTALTFEEVQTVTQEGLTKMMAAAVQKNGVQALANGTHHIDMNSVDCVSSSVSETENQDKQAEDEPAPEIDIVINNVVCSFSVRCHLNLKEIATHGANVEYRKENGMVTMKLRKPYTTASIWSSGKITCTGATSEDNAKIAARRFARSLQKLGFEVRFNNFRVVNVLGTCSMPFGIKINSFSAKYPKDAEYEPEIHPGVTYRLKDPKATLKIFSTGSITVTAPCVSSIAAAIEHIYPLVYEFKKERTKEDELDLELKRQKKNGVRKRKRLDSYEDGDYADVDLVDGHDYNSEEDSDWVIDEALGP